MMQPDYFSRPAILNLRDLKTGSVTRALEGRTAIVTGGGKGIGKAISLCLAEAGAEIVIIGNSNMNMAEETCRLIRSRGGRAVCLGCDLAQPESAEKIVRFTLEQYGKIDILINNAAYQPNLDITEFPAVMFQKVIDVTLMSYLRMTMACLPYLKESSHARIVNIGSVHCKRPNAFDIAYSTAKGGVLMLTRETAVDYLQYGITCNAVLPGGTKIEFKTVRDDMPRIRRERSGFVRPKRNRVFRKRFSICEPNDPANMVVFLCSDAAALYNGVAIRADDGMMLF